MTVPVPASSEEFQQASVVFAEAAVSVAALGRAVRAIDPELVARGGTLGFGLALVLAQGAELLAAAENASQEMRDECDRRALVVADYDLAMAAWAHEMHQYELAVTAWEFDYNAWIANDGAGHEPVYPAPPSAAPAPPEFD